MKIIPIISANNSRPQKQQQFQGLLALTEELLELVPDKMALSEIAQAVKPITIQGMMPDVIFSIKKVQDGFIAQNMSSVKYRDSKAYPALNPQNAYAACKEATVSRLSYEGN